MLQLVQRRFVPSSRFVMVENSAAIRRPDGHITAARLAPGNSRSPRLVRFSSLHAGSGAVPPNYPKDWHHWP